MFLSVFDLFKIGIGPSSSHTVGPMVAARRFVREELGDAPVSRVRVSLHGSLAFTGKGHGTDKAIALGLLGEEPDRIDPDSVDELLASLAATGRSPRCGHPGIAFDPKADILFEYGPPLAGHANGMIFRALDAAGDVVAERRFYSVGGGFVATEEELLAPAATATGGETEPFPFASAREMLDMGESVRTLHRRDDARQRARPRAGC